MLNGLTISQLKLCYNLFSSQDSLFYIGNNKIQHCHDNQWEYYLIAYPDHSYRLLFYPVTLYPSLEPFTNDLNSLIQFYQSNQQLRQYNITRLIVPIGEITKPLFFSTIHHMVTLVIDFLPKYNLAQYYHLSVLPPIRIKIIDSFRLSLPLCHQTENIVAVLDNHFDVRDFKREYINHQNLLDRQSCCYFTLKVIQKLLIDNIPEFTDNILLNNLSPIRKFVDDIPAPDSWLFTSNNWLTNENKQEIQTMLLNYYQQQLFEYNVNEIIDDIIEC